MDDLIDFESNGDCFNMKLLWNASYDEDSSERVFAGGLLTVSGAALPDYDVMICLNETNVVNCTTDGNG